MKAGRVSHGLPEDIKETFSTSLILFHTYISEKKVKVQQYVAEYSTLLLFPAFH